jgi:DNA-binding CsgD family transcriptional regulator
MDTYAHELGTTALGALAPGDVSALLSAIHDVHAEADADRLPAHVLRTLVGLVPCKLAGYTVVDPVSGESSVRLHPPELWPVAEVAARFQAHIADHPVVEHMGRTRDGSARAISDFLSARQFHATGLYQSLFRWIGIEDQLSIALVGGAGLMIGLSFNRARRGFTDRDRTILNAVRPHVLQAHVRARELQLLRNLGGHRRGTVVDRLPIGLVCVDRRGAVVWQTDPARQMLRDHYAHADGSVHGLPDAVRVWLRSARRQARGVPQPLVCHRPGVDLSGRWCPLPDGQGIVTLQETPAAAGGVALSAFGLTAREADVMRCVLQGGSAGDAAGRLGASRRTVEKHLERVFRKLGVNTLAAACVKILGRG